MLFKTSITNVQKNGTEIIRGHELGDLINNNGFVQTIYLLLKGELPNEAQAKMFDAILTSVVDHGPAVASALNARISASARNPLHASVAAGLLGLGERHGVVIEPAMKFFFDHKDETDVAGLLKNMKEQKKYAPGFGHKIFEVDPRTQRLFAIAKEIGIYGSYCEFAQKVEDTLNSISSKKLPLNIDGSIAAILCDMGFDSRVGNGVFVIARVPGLVAHIIEEVQNDEGIRRLEPEHIEYIV
jgi:citryl-CoA lyase